MNFEYEKYKHPEYKYRLVKNYQITLIDFDYESFDYKYFSWNNDTKVLTIKEGYCWDGASKLAIDTFSFMEGSLVHDAFYQFMREKIIPITYKDYADRLLQKICIKNGMSKFRAGYVYWAVRFFGGKYAK